MNPSIVQRAIDLVRKRGGFCVIVDSAGKGEAYTLMPLTEYEVLIKGGNGVTALTENELLDKINRDIAQWKSGKDEDELDNWEEKNLASIQQLADIERHENIKEDPFAANPESVETTPEDKQQFYFEPID